MADDRDDSDLFPEIIRARTYAFTRHVMTQRTPSELCFVIMSFSEDDFIPDVYNRGIKPTVEKAGFRCETVREQHFNGTVSTRIIQNIIEARFIVADLTQARPNCYYEVGIAHALDKEVIHLARKGQEIHFDLKEFNFIIYSGMDELEEKLAVRIAHTVV